MADDKDKEQKEKEQVEKILKAERKALEKIRAKILRKKKEGKLWASLAPART